MKILSIVIGAFRGDSGHEVPSLVIDVGICGLCVD